jgi:hypothetical protein
MSNAKAQIIEFVTAPLGFFVLALLIVESFLATVLILADIQEQHRVTGMYVGVVLFVFLVAIVSLFVWEKPDNLTFDKEAHLRNMNKPPFGTSENRNLDPDELIPGKPRSAE